MIITVIAGPNDNKRHAETILRLARSD